MIFLGKWFRHLLLPLAMLLPVGVAIIAPGTAYAAGCNTAATGAWSNNCDVSEGAYSNYVIAIQYVVQGQEVCQMYITTIDGSFGPDTLAGVECYQSFFNLHVDGIVGPQTWGSMQGALAHTQTNGDWAYYSSYPCQCQANAYFRKWTPTGNWYVYSPVAGAWVRMDTSAP